MGYYGWRPYVPVAEKRRQAERKLATLKKQRQSVTPVTIKGRTIAKSFWGQSWCSNLERYSDYENRLARGRTYLRSGLVVDLQIKKGEIAAMVAGSSLYKVKVVSHQSQRCAGKRSVAIVPEPSTRWLSSCRGAYRRASWTGFVGRATACFRHQRKSNCPAAARTGPICASTLQRLCMALGPDWTNGPSSFLCCATWTNMSCSPVPDRTLR